MARPKSLRRIENIPEVTWFKPAGIQRRSLVEVSLTLDEIEAIRLADLKSFYQAQVAEKMNVSRQTVGRILVSAHKKIADALVNGKSIRLEGGIVHHSDSASNRFQNSEKSAKAATAVSTKAQGKSKSVIRNKNRVVVTATGPDMDAKVDLKFGRAAYLLVIDLTDDSLQVIDNSVQSSESGGKGVKTANTVLQTDVGAVITGNMGERALSELSGAGIGLFKIDGGTVQEAVESYRLEEIER